MSNSPRPDRLLLGSLLALLLSACGGGGDAPPEASTPAPPPAAQAASPAADTPQSTGLTPLPTPNEVLASVKIGRDDPFAAIPSPSSGGAAARRGATTQARLTLPPAFRFSGVIRSGGASQAIVEYGATSGALSVGDRGGRTTDLLPSGWTVAAINVDRGQLTLRQGKQTVSAEL
ncbi:hypothetical protein [Cyanobium sp. NIES-981]|uniref:hypothetical protein n=1 Tax=Cyanobium sp. NIES-981 TaxID=1851505 RepID=UPI000B34E5D7|nr:hypothetical protein [Cyanobium sp. NIES-981]